MCHPSGVGTEITYCFKCQRRIVGTEFAKGEAYQVGDNVTCAACAADLLGMLQGKERQQLLSQMFKRTNERKGIQAGKASAPVDTSTTRTIAAHPPSSRRTVQAPSANQQNALL